MENLGRHLHRWTGNILALGEITHDIIGAAPRLSVDDTATFLDTLAVSFGGRGANFALASRAINASVVLLAAVGRDLEQSGYRRHLEESGVDVSQLYVSAQERTPSAFIFNDPYSSRVFFHGRVLSESGFRESITRLLSAAGRYEAVYCTSGSYQLNLEVLQRVSARLRVFAPGHEVSEHPVDNLSNCLGLADIAIMNEHEADILSRRLGTRVDNLAAHTHGKSLVMTRGGRGVVVFDRGTQSQLPSVPAAVVDPTGAGDSFAGIFVPVFLCTGDLLLSSRVATVAGALAVETVGAQPKFSIDQILRRYESHYGGADSAIGKANRS